MPRPRLSLTPLGASPASPTLLNSTFGDVAGGEVVGGVVVGVGAEFNTLIPQMLNYAELRIQRDLDLLPSQTSLNYNITIGTNLLQLPVDDFVTVQTISVVDGTARTPMVPVTKEWLQNLYNDSSYAAKPQYFAMLGGDQASGGNTFNNIINFLINTS